LSCDGRSQRRAIGFLKNVMDMLSKEEKSTLNASPLGEERNEYAIE
jgi:hypothetical protein